MEHKFKVGDRVRRIYDHGNPKWPHIKRGYTFTIGRIDFRCIYEENDVTPHDPDSLELVPLTTAEKLAEAEAQVAALKAQLVAESAPKVGSYYYNKTGTERFKVLDIYAGRVFGRREQSPGGESVCAGSHLIDDFWNIWSHTN